MTVADEALYGFREKKSSSIAVGGLSPVDYKYQAYYRPLKNQSGESISSNARLYDANGKESDEVYHGLWEVYYQGFLVHKGQYVNGLKEGEWKWFHPKSRKLVRIENYKNDRRLGWFEFNHEGYLLEGEDWTRNVSFTLFVNDCDHKFVLSREEPHLLSFADRITWQWHYSQGKYQETPGATVTFSRGSRTDDCSDFKPGNPSNSGLRYYLSIYQPNPHYEDVYYEEMCNIDGKTTRIDYYDKTEYLHLVLEPEDAYIETSQPMVTLSNYVEFFSAMYSYLSEESESVEAKNPQAIIEKYNKQRKDKNQDDKKDQKDKDDQDKIARQELYKKLQPYFEHYQQALANAMYHYDLFRNELMSIFQIGLSHNRQTNQICGRYQEIKSQLDHPTSVTSDSSKEQLKTEMSELQSKCTEMTEKRQVWDDAFAFFDTIPEQGHKVYALRNHRALNHHFTIKTDELSAAAIKFDAAFKISDDARLAVESMGGRVGFSDKGEPVLLLK